MNPRNLQLFNLLPEFKKLIPWTQLISTPTPVHKLDSISKKWGNSQIFTKREDKTDEINYGGNKVRNLEFILADVINHNKQDVLSIVPYGSNFAAALSSQSKKLNLNVILSQFVVEKNPQVIAHDFYCQSQGAKAYNYPGKISAPIAAVDACSRFLYSQIINDRSYWVAAGGSSAYGALGHVEALLELKHQVENGELPQPDYIILGAGTCGTIAGLNVGVKLAGWNTKIIGVRAADSIICNKIRIAQLTNQVFKLLNVNYQITTNEIYLMESPNNKGYGYPTESAQDIINEFYEEEKIILDSTYTSKVILYLKDQLLNYEFTEKNILYWHTYSPKAYSFNN